MPTPELTESATRWTADPRKSWSLTFRQMPDGRIAAVGANGVMFYRPEELDFELGVTRAHP